MTFYQRRPIENFPPVIAGMTAENGTPEDRLNWLKVLIGYMGKFPNDLADDKEFPLLPLGVKRSDAGEAVYLDMKRDCAWQAVQNCLTDKLVGVSARTLEDEITRHPGKYNKIVIVYPTHLLEDNWVTDAINVELKKKLQSDYGDRIGGLPVTFSVAEGTADKLPVFTAVRRTRGAVKASKDASPLQAMVGNKLANQVVAGGTVDREALHWIVDDGITIGGTVRNYVGHIHDHDGTVGVVTTLTKRSKGVDIIPVQPESLQALRETLRDIDPAAITHNEEALGRILAGIGIRIDFDHPAATTATNQEVLLLAGYFARPGNARHETLIDTALRAIGTSFAESPHSYAVKAAKLEPGNVAQLEQMIHTALGNEILRKHYSQR